MRLATFIEEHGEAVLAEWESFARSLPGGRELDTVALRDHAAQMLATIAHDMRCAQSASERHAKSQGRRPRADAVDTAAETHADSRFEHGFTLEEMIAEYRALRASVLKLWLARRPDPATAVEDVMRFNEAIDEALAESTERLNRELEHARELAVGTVGHDMRTPIGAIRQSARVLTQSSGLTPRETEAVAIIVRSSTRLGLLTANLLDTAVMRLGRKLRLRVEPVNLGALCRQVVDEASAIRPDRRVETRMTGPVEGTWDPARLQQLLANLVENALRYGAPTEPVTVELGGTDDEVTVTVHNGGTPIDPGTARALFQPFARGTKGDIGSASLGLGLYSARQIALAHGGDLTFTSTAADGTSFVVRLPRHAA